MIRKMNIGIIGLGVGKHHFDCFSDNKYCNIVSVCDFNLSKLKKIKLKNTNIEITTKEDKIINNPNIDLVCIASYDNHHAKQVINSIKNNKHVFVEKPICTNFSEYKKIKSELKKKPHLKIASNLVLRTSPQFLKLSNMIKNRKFGKIYMISGEYNYGRLSKITNGWRGKLKNYSVTHGGAIHIIDLVISFIRKKPKLVSAMGNNISTKGTIFKNNDLTNSSIKFENNLIFNITSNFGCVMPHHHTLKIYGTKLSFVQEFNSAKIYSSRLSKNPKILVNKNYLNKDKKKVLESFICSLATNQKKKSLVTTNEVLNSMAISLTIDKSIKTKKYEKINY
jgi:predicted dehydrogenase